jgi:hypothetical protein
MQDVRTAREGDHELRANKSPHPQNTSISKYLVVVEGPQISWA